MKKLQLRLDRGGQFLPGEVIDDAEDLVHKARVSASSALSLDEIKANKAWVSLDHGWAMLMPLNAGSLHHFSVEINSSQSGALRVELLRSSKSGNFTPDQLVEAVEIPFVEGGSEIKIEFRSEIDVAGYYFVKLCEDPAVRVRVSDERMTGILAVSNAYNKAVATSSRQIPPPDIGIDEFEFWLPKRRPEGRNLAMKIDPPVEVFGGENVQRGPSRPTNLANAWVASRDDENPEINFSWQEAVEMKKLVIEFDPDWDHPMESVLMSHPEEVPPFMVKDFDLVADGNVIAEIRNHHGARFEWVLDGASKMKILSIRIRETYETLPAIFRVRVY